MVGNALSLIVHKEGEVCSLSSGYTSSANSFKGLEKALEIYKESGIDMTKFMKDKSETGKQKFEKDYGVEGLFGRK